MSSDEELIIETDSDSDEDALESEYVFNTEKHASSTLLCELKKKFPAHEDFF